MQLHFESTGTGIPVIILHGLFGSGDNWRSVARNLSAEYQVLTIDQRNHGRSPHSMLMDYPLMAGDVQALLTAHASPPAHVIGHSMGGKTAMQLALDFPELVRSLVVVDIAPKRYPRLHDRILEALCALDLSAFNSRQEMEEALSPAIPDLDVRRFLLKSIVRGEQERFQWQLGLDEIAANYEALGAGISSDRSFNGPTLFIRGTRSDYISDEDEPLIQRWFPRAGVREIEGASHWVHAEKPQEFLASVREFLVAH